MKAITCKSFGPSNVRGSRIKASEPDGKSVILPYDHSKNIDGNYLAAAEALKKKMGWKGKMVSGWTGKTEVFVFTEEMKTPERIEAECKAHLKDICELVTLPNPEHASTRAKEIVLGILARSDWQSCDDGRNITEPQGEFNEFCLILSMGGPSIRLFYETNDDEEITSVKMLWQEIGDWKEFEFSPEIREALIAFGQLVIFP